MKIYDIKLNSSSNEKCFTRTREIIHFVFNNLFFYKNPTIYETMWKNVVEPDRPQMTVTHALCMLDK
jgi:hypothetical protein